MSTEKSFRLLVAAGDKTATYLKLLSECVPQEVTLIAQGDPHDATAIDGLVGWKLPADFLKPYRNLQVVFGLGAGVDAFLKRSDLAPGVQVVKLSDAGMAAQMTEYALLGILHWQRHLDEYRADQQQAKWAPRPPRLRADTRVTVLGLGAIGSQVARELAALGYAVRGWRRSAATLANIRCLHGLRSLPGLLGETDVLINLLPSTHETLQLLNEERLGALPQGAYVVNASRGDQLDAGALLRLLDSGHLSGALLDAFVAEPLPSDSPLWRHPRITLTPHVAAITLPEESARQIGANLARRLRGEAMTGVVDRAAGY